MENVFRNEMEVTLAGEKILLRPTFENIVALESKLGGLPYLAWKFSQSGGKSGTLTDCAQIIYFNQVATNPSNPTQKLYSLEQVWDMVQKDGITVLNQVLTFLAKITAGDKMATPPSEAQKKS